MHKGGSLHESPLHSASQEMHCWPPGEKKKADDLMWCQLLSHGGSCDATTGGLGCRFMGRPVTVRLGACVAEAHAS